MGIRRSCGPVMVGTLLALLLPASIHGRVWAGRGQLEVRVRSSEGGPVSGAEVELLFLEAQPPSGPPVETTDSSGRATISGLAAGTWSIRVRHPDHLTYGARLEIEIGRKIDELQAFHQSEGEGGGILRIDYEKVRRGPPPPPRPTPPSPPNPETSDYRRDVEPPPTARTPEAEPKPRDTRPAEAAPGGRGAEDSSAPEPSATSDRTPPAEELPSGSSPEPETPERPASALTDQTQGEEEDEEKETPSTADTSPAPGPALEELPERASPEEPAGTPGESETPPEAPEEERGGGELDVPEEGEMPESAAPADRDEAPASPSPEPPGTPTQEEAGEPAAEPPTTPRPEARLRSASGGTCPDCRPGETALSVDAVAAPGGSDGTCPEDARARARETIADLIASLSSGAGSFYGPLADPDLRDVLSLTPPEGRAMARSALGELLFPKSACRLLAILLPADAEFTGFRYEARGVDGRGDCLPERECPIGSARWLGVPDRIREQGREVVFGLFLNTSPNRERHPRLTVYFRR
ncbi:MAG: hypothetical protein R3234_02885 [Thermoanaerobaculia bacterium]|nr:hypothetical protein [Thermoanaerobaculia bacterium]